jgi:hypothetical protein
MHSAAVMFVVRNSFLRATLQSVAHSSAANGPGAASSPRPLQPPAWLRGAFVARPPKHASNRWQVGDVVEAHYSNGDWYRATIVAVRVAGISDAQSSATARRRRKKVSGSSERPESSIDDLQYELAWEDGDTLETVKSAHDIRAAAAGAPENESHQVNGDAGDNRSADGNAKVQKAGMLDQHMCDSDVDMLAHISDPVVKHQSGASCLHSEDVLHGRKHLWVKECLMERALQNYISALDALDYQLQPTGMCTFACACSFAKSCLWSHKMMTFSDFCSLAVCRHVSEQHV